MQGRVLIIAGSDSGGGAGIQADIKTVTMLGGYAATALTALTAQNTKGVAGIEAVPAAFVRQQMEAVLSDIGADALKTGMLHTTDIVETVADVLAERAAGLPLVVDPVAVAKGGARLLDAKAMAALKERLLPLASVATPNLPEAEALAGRPIAADGLEAAAQALLALGPRAVLLKGGHLEGNEVRDVLATPEGIETFTSPRIETRHTHGTGCTLASAIATGLAQGLDLRAAVCRARAYVAEAIRTAPGFGEGHGPLNHGHPLKGGAA
ncbi:MAG: bifunctional hydroxymethylpyrimidine kinase/phosphomethylpyrimidine kinase [Alphaproteobacteria bacterium]|nr:bifunctional hydroxymethylpyrimidine kinase/phosphomethylpyrimidine kinase [Alphaproteobacteria bacterium]